MENDKHKETVVGPQGEGGAGCSSSTSPPDPQNEGAPDWFYKSIEDVSKSAAQVYLIYMSFLAYTALTAVSTPG